MLKVLPIVVVFVVAVYFGVRTAQRRLSGKGPARPGRGQGPRRPMGPDDDPDFLRGLGN